MPSNKNSWHVTYQNVWLPSLNPPRTFSTAPHYGPCTLRAVRPNNWADADYFLSLAAVTGSDTVWQRAAEDFYEPPLSIRSSIDVTPRRSRSVSSFISLRTPKSTPY